MSDCTHIYRIVRLKKEIINQLLDLPAKIFAI